jgi:hypothetical protein
MTIVRDFGEKGVRCQFWQDGQWQPGRAWKIDERGVHGRCRDYCGGAARTPLETHGIWPLEEVRGLEKHIEQEALFAERPAPKNINAIQRERQLVALRAKSPMRSTAEQHDASGLSLFAHANEPRLI